MPAAVALSPYPNRVTNNDIGHQPSKLLEYHPKEYLIPKHLNKQDDVSAPDMVSQPHVPGQPVNISLPS